MFIGADDMKVVCIEKKIVNDSVHMCVQQVRVYISNDNTVAL